MEKNPGQPALAGRTRYVQGLGRIWADGSKFEGGLRERRRDGEGRFLHRLDAKWPEDNNGVLPSTRENSGIFGTSLHNICAREIVHEVSKQETAGRVREEASRCGPDVFRAGRHVGLLS